MAAAKESELCVFFRNNHFSTMTKHRVGCTYWSPTRPFYRRSQCYGRACTMWMKTAASVTLTFTSVIPWTRGLEQRVAAAPQKSTAGRPGLLDHIVAAAGTAGTRHVGSQQLGADPANAPRGEPPTPNTSACTTVGALLQGRVASSGLPARQYRQRPKRESHSVLQNQGCAKMPHLFCQKLWLFCMLSRINP